jgi:hypothetical protein
MVMVKLLITYAKEKVALHANFVLERVFFHGMDKPVAVVAEAVVDIVVIVVGLGWKNAELAMGKGDSNLFEIGEVDKYR